MKCTINSHASGAHGLPGHIVSQGKLSSRAHYLRGILSLGARSLWGILSWGRLSPGQMEDIKGSHRIKNVKKSEKVHKDVLDFFEFGKNLKFDDPPLVPNLKLGPS